MIWNVPLERVRLAQLDRAFGYGPKGRGFESSNAHTSPCIRKAFFNFLEPSGSPADMAELADAQDLGSCIERCKGSSPSVRMHSFFSSKDTVRKKNV